MDLLSGLLRVDLQIAVVCTDANVLFAVVDLDQLGFRVSLQFLCHGVDKWHELC